MKPASWLMKGSKLAALLICASLSGCVVPQGDGTYGYDTTVDASFDTGVDYVEPVGAVVGGWSSAYNVAPPPPRFIGGGPPPVGGRPQPGAPMPRQPNFPGGIHPSLPAGGPHAYKPPPATHSAPSIPSAHRK